MQTSDATTTLELNISIGQIAEREFPTRQVLHNKHQPVAPIDDARQTDRLPSEKIRTTSCGGGINPTRNEVETDGEHQLPEQWIRIERWEYALPPISE